MYSISVKGRTGPETDIAKVRFYIDGAQNGADVAVSQPNAAQTPFSATLTCPSPGPITIGYSFIDATGNESAQHSQSFVVPDKDAPTMPASDLEVVSVVWA